MSRILIVEDEAPAAARLIGFIEACLPGAEIVGPISTVEETVSLLEKEKFDLLFLDVHLADGQSFELFKEVKVDSPVIFITAFDQYALDAFKHNGIDYLLKPLKKVDLERAIEKYSRFFEKNPQQAEQLKALADMLSGSKPESRMKRLMVRYGARIKMVDPNELAYVVSKDKISYLSLFNGETLPSDFTMDELENSLDAERFFRISRQMLVNLNAVEDMTVFSKSRLKITLNPKWEEECLVSAERTPAFKAWLSGKN